MKQSVFPQARSVGLMLLGMLLLSVGDAIAQTAELPTAAVVYQTASQEHIFDAVVEAVNQATVSAQISGRVVEIKYDVDDFVPKGSVILRFDDTELQAEVAAAEAAQREQQARFDEVKAEHQRISELYQRKLVAKAELDKAVAGLRAGEQRLQAAQANLRKAREQLSYTVVKAPYSGIVTKRHVETGETARVGQPLMSGFSLQELRATTRVPQHLIDAIRRHNQARVFTDDHTSIPASELTFYPYADPKAHTFQVRVQLQSGVEGIYPGMLVKLAFVTGEQQRLVVPRSAVAYRSEVSAVYVVDEQGKLGFRQVRLGRVLDDEYIEVLSGVQAGMQVALDPVLAAIQLKQQRASEAP